jgi:lipoprotein-anchoring transpeptidase ErfK/SrfK
MDRYGRAGIGIHGGGSGLPAPFAARQGWAKTHGCVRVQNEDLTKLVKIVKGCLAAGGHVRLTVSGEAA